MHTYALTFDDILLVPKLSEIKSRKEVDVSTDLGYFFHLDVPLIASCMDSVSELDMAIAMAQLGGLAIVHRYMSITDQVNIISRAREVIGPDKPLIAAVGTKDIMQRTEELLTAGISGICVDVAHGHHSSVFKAVQDVSVRNFVASNGDPLFIIAGNVATYEGAVYLANAGADAIRVGIGNGSICTTRLVTGHGIPQVTALLECNRALKDEGFEESVSLISDGGVKDSGDIVKALACGAAAIMSGSLFSGTDESPGEVITDHSGKKFKIYRGMSSKEAQESFFGNYVEAPEGVTTTTSYKGPVSKVVQQLVGGIRSGLSYSGVTNIKDLQRVGSFAVVSPASRIESLAASPYKG